MKPLHQILPSLETSVANRELDPHVQTLDERELRALIYKLVEGYQRKFADPEKWFDAMVVAANDRSNDVRLEKCAGANVREKILSRLLRICSRALPAIGTPIRTLVNRGGADQQYTTHPLLRGIELGGSRKQLAQADGLRAIVGRTWWVISLAGRTAVPDSRWAIMDHTGSLDAKGFGEERIEITLSDPIELSTMVNDRIVGGMISTLANQLGEAGDASSSIATARLRAKLERALGELSDEEDLPRAARG